MKKSLLTLTLGGLGIGITEFVMMGLLPDIAKDLNITIPQAGHLISSYALGVVVGAPVLVAIAGSYPPKKILLALMVMFTAFNALSAFSPDYTTMLAARFLAGLPHGAFFGVGSVVASRIAGKGKEAQAVSLMFAGLTIANVIGVPLGTYIGHHYSWRYTFVIIVIVGLITLLSLKLWMPNLSATKDRDLKKELAFFKLPEAWLIILMIAIGTGGLFSWYSYIAPLLTDVSGFSPDSITYILVLAGLGMLVGNFIGGKLADRFSPAKASVSLLIAMAITLFIVHYISGNQVLSLVMTFITGAVAFALAAPIQMLMINTAKGSEMIAASVSQASFNIGNALGAFLGGLPLAAGYDYTSPVWVGTVMALTGALFAWMLISRNKTMVLAK
ncbi:MFS transporter, DHA1 family, arabinose polymer transporter [Pedobacter steynii]|uniref:MFS transporter, DHA1 family, arabinose polymer transporter n=1 Tax=Pedobacter steynii TaxID=430522 RepID=A0A1H0B7N0_9SPHI|nr:MFS transporter [Pedobacter steynii]NQX41132.1 MFS transporter [Pedobacter steynii]SDN41659.1 MFS transporter, DHA1 family, arabinose polymer transporter [Pedobacter steynii]